MRHHHDHTLIREIVVFDHTYLPEYFNHRDAQLQELAYLIGPALQETVSSTAPRGTGKTTTVRRVFALS